MSAQISRNAGRNWELLELFRYSHGFTTYQFNFDWAEKGHWFYKSGDGYNDLDYERQPDRYFETFDNGKTFREIKFDPTNQVSGYPYTTKYFGFDGIKTFRDMFNDLNQYIRVVEYDVTLKSSTLNDWLFIMDPSKPKSNNDSGYFRALFSYHEQFKSSMPSHIFLPVIVNYKDQKIDNNIYLNTTLYSTIDNGKSWTFLNFLDEVPLLGRVHLDQGTNILWLQTIDEKYESGQHQSYLKRSLWKLKLPWGASSVEDFKGDDDNISIYPNPATEYVEIRSSYINPTVNRRVDESSDIKIYNTLGECVMTVETRHAVSLQRIDVSHLPSGVYFVKITTNNQIYFKKVMVFR